MTGSSSKALPATDADRDTARRSQRQSFKDFKRMLRSGKTISTIDLQRRKSGASLNSKKKLTLRQSFLLLRRLLVFATTILYIMTSIGACVESFQLISDADIPPCDYMLYKSKLIAEYAGTESVRHSPMLAALGNDTTPRSVGTLYLEEAATSFAGCSGYVVSPIYEDVFQRKFFGAIRSSLAYNLTFLDPSKSELIMPVVDCTFTALLVGDLTAPRFFYLLRALADPNDVYIFSVTAQIQEYTIESQKTVGPSAFITMAFVNDMHATAIEHYIAIALGYPFKDAVFERYNNYGLAPVGFWRLKSQPANPKTSVPKVVFTTCPIGYYSSSPNEQANIVYVGWHFFQDPSKMLADWVWKGTPVVKDSWGWVHLLHLYFAVNAIIGIGVMAIVMYYNLRAGKIWVGDAFVAVASSHWLRSALVLVSWQIDKFWSLTEFALFSGNELYGERTTIIYPNIMRADLLSLYITIVSLIGEIFRERIDPALTLLLFALGFDARLSITRLFPRMVTTLVDYANYEYILGVMPLDPSVPERSPVRVWSSKEVPTPNAAIIFAALFPIFVTLVFIIAYVAVRKIYRWKNPGDRFSSQRSSANSNLVSVRDGMGQRSNLTQFEFATGVALRDCFGVVSDYDNYVFIKGMRFASADGIYTSAFVIANGKFLVDIGDLVAIFVIKLTRVRFRNVYVYEVEGNTVKQTARLVYPATMSFRDLLHLSLRVLL